MSRREGFYAPPIGLKKREETGKRYLISHIAQYIRYCFHDGMSRREGFYAVRMRHPSSPSIHRSLPTKGDGREKLCNSRSCRGMQEGRKTPPYIISHRESKTDKLYNTGNGRISFSSLLLFISSTIFRLMRIGQGQSLGPYDDCAVAGGHGTNGGAYTEPIATCLARALGQGQAQSLRELCDLFLPFAKDLINVIS